MALRCTVSREVEEVNRRLLRARDAMDRAYAETLNVRSVAAVAHISEAHFVRSFRYVFGGNYGAQAVMTWAPFRC
jgi:AraC-like DNA-binding protein